MMSVRTTMVLCTGLFAASANAQSFGMDNFVLQPTYPLTTGTLYLSDEESVEKILQQNDSLPFDESQNLDEKQVLTFLRGRASFVPSEQTRQERQRIFVDKVRTFDQKSASMLNRQVQANEIFPQASVVLNSVGLNDNNLADTYTSWLLSSYDVIEENSLTSDPAVVEAVNEQVVLALALEGKMLDLSNSEKQFASDDLLLNAVLIAASLELVKDNPSERRAYAEKVKNIVRASGVDFDTLVLTREGFKPREGADASEVIGGEDAPALAVSEDADSSTPTYLAIAAAATLGLGGAFWLGKRSS